LRSITRWVVFWALLAAMAAGLVACGGGSEAPEGERQSENPKLQGLVEKTNFNGVKSAEFEVRLEIADQVKGEVTRMRANGIFLGAGQGKLPLFDIGLLAHGPFDGRELEFVIGLALLPKQLVAYYEDEMYELGPEQLRSLKASFQKVQKAGGEGDVNACSEALDGLKISRVVDGLANEAPVVRVSGNLDVSAAIDVLIELLEDPGCGSQLAAIGVPSARALEGERGRITEAVEEARVELALGKGGVLRNLVVELTARPEEADGGEGELDIRFEFILWRLNEIARLPSLQTSKPLAALFRRLGVNPLEELKAGRSEGIPDLLEALAP
jgi:hypothetical protein